MQNTQTPEYAIETKNLFIFYGSFPAVSEVNMKIEKQKVTAIIGPSGCGKSTLLRAFNRMNDFVPSSYVTGNSITGTKPVWKRHRSRGSTPQDRHGLSKAESISKINLRKYFVGRENQRLQGKYG